MKALLSLAPGGPETLQLTDVPEPAAATLAFGMMLLTAGGLRSRRRSSVR